MMINRIENKKYKGLGIFYFFFTFFIISILLISIVVFAKEFHTDKYPWLRAFDSYIMFKLFLNPILLASLCSRVVDMETEGNMWKVLFSLGLEYKKIYRSKFFVLISKFALYQLIEYIAIIILIKFNTDDLLPFYTVIRIFISQFGISFLLMSIYYNIAMRYENQIINLSIGIISSFIGIIGILIPKYFRYIILPSWYGYLLSLNYIKTSSNSYEITLFEPQYWLLISFVLGILIFYFGEKFSEVKK